MDNFWTSEYPSVQHKLNENTVKQNTNFNQLVKHIPTTSITEAFSQIWPHLWTKQLLQKFKWAWWQERERGSKTMLVWEICGISCRVTDYVQSYVLLLPVFYSIQLDLTEIEWIWVGKHTSPLFGNNVKQLHYVLRISLTSYADDAAYQVCSGQTCSLK